MPNVTLAQRLATQAFRHELQRLPTVPAELKPLTKAATALLTLDKSDNFIRRALERVIDHRPEAQAIHQANGAANALLGHAPDSALLQQARDLFTQGKSPTDIRAALEQSIQAGPEYRKLHAGETVTSAYQASLQRAPTDDEKVKGVQWAGELIDQGKSNDEINGAFSYVLAQGPEFRKLHSADNVNGVYAMTMGRAPTGDELSKGKDLVGQLIDQGKNNDEVNQTLDYLCKLSPEWQAKHPQMSHDRDAIYMKQPTGWTCGPTSLAMAMAAAGKRPANEDTIWEMAQPDKLNTITNHSTDKSPWEIADIAHGMGVNAEGHAGASAADMRAALEAGHGIMVNVKEPDTGGHFVYIAGVDAGGQMIVCDPWHPETTTWSDQTLSDWSRAAPGPGNFVEFWP